MTRVLGLLRMSAMKNTWLVIVLILAVGAIATGVAIVSLGEKETTEDAGLASQEPDEPEPAQQDPEPRPEPEPKPEPEPEPEPVPDDGIVDVFPEFGSAKWRSLHWRQKTYELPWVTRQVLAESRRKTWKELRNEKVPKFSIGNLPAADPLQIDASLRLKDVTSALAVDWLLSHQASDGSWQANVYQKDSAWMAADRNSSPGGVMVQTGPVDWSDESLVNPTNLLPFEEEMGHEEARIFVTGLALLALIESRVEDQSAALTAGIKRLQEKQHETGRFVDGITPFSQFGNVLATYALVRHFDLRGGTNYDSQIAKRGVMWLAGAQRADGGWGPAGSTSDLLTTTWALLTLKAAHKAGFRFARYERYRNVKRYLELVGPDRSNTEEITRFSEHANDFPSIAMESRYRQTPLLEACNLLCRLLIKDEEGISSMNPVIVENLKQRILAAPPQWYEESDEARGPWHLNLQHWYIADQAFRILESEECDNWRKELAKQLALHQRGTHKKDVARFGKRDEYEADPTLVTQLPDEMGSWDPVGPISQMGGRVYSTSIGALIQAVEHEEEPNTKDLYETE